MRRGTISTPSNPNLMDSAPVDMEGGGGGGGAAASPAASLGSNGNLPNMPQYPIPPSSSASPHPPPPAPSPHIAHSINGLNTVPMGAGGASYAMASPALHKLGRSILDLARKGIAYTVSSRFRPMAGAKRRSRPKSERAARSGDTTQTRSCSCYQSSYTTGFSTSLF